MLDLSHAYGAFTENTYIRFNNPVLPAGGQFASATLTYNWQGYGTASAALLIYSLDSSWTETGLNYTYHPLWTTPSTGIGNIVGNSCGGRCTSWAPKTVDVSPVIGGMYIANFPNNGMVLTISDPANDCSSCSWTDITLESRESGFPPLLTVYYNCCMGNVETLDGNVADGDSFSATADAQLGTHTLYREAADGTVTYAYHAAMSSSWTFSANIFSGPASYPTITCDYSTGDVFAMGVEGSSGSVIAMRRKSMAGLWADNTAVFPVTGRAGVKELGSNAASASEAGSSSILLFWTEGTISPYSATFARVPVQTVWSPYSAPGDPWDKNGLAPYGQYFSNLGESVSPSTGMLTVRQTDLSVPGRGLDLAITRVYTEPFSFHNGSPYNYETYPWAPMGNGWQLNFPWFNNTAQPLYIHLWDGQGYRIPYNFWFTAPTFENDQGVSFRMVRYSNNSVTLYTGSGDSYFFNPDHSLSTITDATGTNRIIFSYSSNLISCITDTLGRAFLFIYSGRSLQRIAQAYGSCSNPQAFARSVAYMYNGQSLNATVDPAGRITGYAYNATGASTAPWLLARTSYPTHGYSNYTYTVSPQGTESYSYRVSRQYVSSFSAPRIRESDFIYQNAGGNGGGDQVTSSSITSYDGTSTTPLSITSYSFSFMGVNWNVSDGSRNFLRGVEQIFDTHGDISQEINLVTDRTIIGSYTNYYRYDLWGNQIYSRRAVNLSTVKEHFNAYYNDGLSPGFNVFQDTFSDSGLTRPDNFWNSTGLWTVQNGIYNGTYDGKNGLAWSSLGKIAINPISIQAQVYPSRATQQNGEVGLFVDYGGTGTRRLSLLLDSYGLFILNKFDNGTLVSYASSSCPYTNVAWYKLSLTESLSQVIGWVSGPGLYCQVQLSLSPSYSASGSGFGLYVRGYSALFDNVTVTTAISSTNGSDFSNSFMPKGGPGSNIHDALAGSAELNGPLPVEEYNSYYPSGKLSQTAQLYYSSSVVSPSDTQWLNTSRYYDSYGDLVKLVDSTGNYTSYGYSFNPTAYFMTETQILKPGGTQVSRFFQYDFTKGALTLSDDARGYNTTYSYDILGRTIRATYPTGDYEAYSYNDQANYVNVTNENGWLTQQKYDSLGRLASVTRFSGSNAYSTRFYTYNAMDQVTNMTDALGNRFSYQYDALGRVTSVVEPNGYSTRTAYKDCCTFVYVSNIDENGVTNCNYYDRLGRLLNGVENASSTCRPGITTSYSYDAIGNLVQVQTSTLQTIRYAYDNLNRLVNSTYPDGTVEKYSYNKGSNLVLKVDRNSVQTNYSYDSLNRPSAIIYHGTTVTSDNYTYDGNGNLLKLTSQNATLTYNYDSRNRVTGETYSINGGHVTGPLASPSNGPSVPPGTFSSGYSFTYSYTGETLARITYNDFMTTDYTYDGLSRVASVRINTATSHPNATTFSYYPNDRMKGIVFGNGLVASYTYDPVSRPVQLTLKNSTSTLLSLTYSYNNTGTVKSVTGSVNGANISEQYGYDPLRRLTNSLLIKGSTTTTLSYVYDSVGNRQSQTTNGPTTISYSYNPSNNELASSTWYSSHYAYNPTGNLKQWNYTLGTLQTKAYSWDVPGNLVKFFQNGSLQAAYAYDGLGRRVESEEGSTVTFYAYLGTETMVERAPSGADTDYVYANGLRIARVTGAGGVIPTIVYYHEDALGSTRLVTSSTKTVLFSDSYQPYGLDNGTPTGSETYKFTGKPYSAATGLYYDYQRWYDPSLGRFISLDPFAGHLSSPQSLNSYSYGENAPTVLTDPSGLDSCNALDIFSWGGCASNVWNSATSAWNGLSPEEQQGLILIGFIALTAATGGTDLLVLGAVGAAAAAGTYVGATYATGGTPTLAGALTWANIGFGSGTGLDSLGDLAFSARSGLGEISAAERLAANRAAGLGFEERVANMFGLTRNIGVGRTMLEGTETAGRAVPDFVGDTFFGEAKFTQNSVYLTKQIRIMIEGASKAGKDLRIFVPEGTRVAPSVFERGFELGVKVLRIPVP